MSTNKEGPPPASSEEERSTDVQPALNDPELLKRLKARAQSQSELPAGQIASQPAPQPPATPQARPSEASEGLETQKPQGVALLWSQDPEAQSALEAGCQLHQLEVRSHGEFPSVLAARITVARPALVVLDASGSSFTTAFDHYRQLRQTVAFAPVPVLFLIDPNQTNEALDACNLQNNDYIVKPLAADLLHGKLGQLLPSDGHAAPQFDAAKSRFDPGTLLNRRYEITRFLGEGGMGQVYLADDLKDGGSVAIKMLFNEGLEGSGENQAAKRFQKEIEALLALDHPNVVKLYDFGRFEGCSYYTMELLSSGSLEDVLDAKGALTYMQALQILIPIASALHHAHTKDILHRDLKPANIMFRKGGVPVLTDFGLALHIEAAQTRLTQKGHIIGTVNYMSPEQIKAPHTLDARSDIYALGAMFFEMITGNPPYEGDEPMVLIRQILMSPPPVAHERYAEIPPKVSEFCSKAMAKNRDHRFANAAAMVAAAAMLLSKPG